MIGYRDLRFWCLGNSGRVDHSHDLEIAPDEFIRRFLLQVLPKGFHRICHSGLLASATCKANIARARELIAVPVPPDPRAEDDNTDQAAGVVDQ